MIFALLSVIGVCRGTRGGVGCIIFEFDPVPQLPLGTMLVIAIQSVLLPNSREFCGLSINPPLA